MTKQATQQMSEESMINFMRNALVVAGEEMGADGDHWPVINSTVHSMMKTFEDAKIERSVDAEMKKHLYAYLEGMEKTLPDCDESERATFAGVISNLRDICDAYFEAHNENDVQIDQDNLSPHVKRARAILATLDGDDNEE